MQKLENGLWFSKNSVDLKRFTAKCDGRIYHILAEDRSQAEEKASDHFYNLNFTLE